MRDATGATQSVLVLGGTSELAVAVVDRLLGDRTRRVVLAARNADAARAQAARLGEQHPDAAVSTVAYDATDPSAHESAIRAAMADGDIDVVLVAFGALGDPFALDGDPAVSADIATVNFTAAVAACQCAADALQRQGHGSLVVFSSVAGARVRPENAVYGASKAGLDKFARALADQLHDSAVHVMIVRPGFVHTKMTEGRPVAPFATTAEAVAIDVVDGLRTRKRIVWSPAGLRYVFSALQVLPGSLWRRLAT